MAKIDRNKINRAPESSYATNKGPFIKDIIKQGGGRLQNIILLLNLFMMTKGGGGFMNGPKYTIIYTVE